MRSAWLLGLVLLAHASAVASAEAVPSPPSPSAPRTVVLMQLDGPIGPAAADLVHRGLVRAAKEKARLAVIQIDTPGGLDDATHVIVKDILASPVPVAAFVSPRGASVAGAGTEILRASHVMAMTPEAHVEVAEEAGQERLSAPQALKKRVVHVIARDIADLLIQVNGRDVAMPQGTVRLATQRVQLLAFEDDWRTRLLSVITTPSLALVLLMVGVCGLLFEFASPGFVLPGVVGAFCLTLALYGLQMLPVSWVGLGLILLGVAMLLGEAFLPTFGVLGLAGVAALATGSVLLIDRSTTGFDMPLWVVAAVTALSSLYILVVAGVVARARRPPTSSGITSLVGTTGELVEFSEGEGWAQIEGDYWPVTGSGDLHTGRRVRVSGVQGVVLHVAPDGP